MTERDRSNIKCEIVERIGELNSYPTGWKKEFNVVRWNDKQEKYDIRDWSPGYERMSRGVTMHEDEVVKLMELCEQRFGYRDECGEKTPGDTAVNSRPENGSQGTPAEDVPF